MPQLDISSFSSQIFWLLICFFSLYFVVSTFFTPKMDKILDERQHIIDEHIEKARTHKNNANKLFEQHENAVDEAQDEAAKNYDAAIKELKKFVDEKKQALQHEMDEYTEKAMDIIRKDREDAAKKIDDAAIAIAENIVKKIGIKNISKNNLEKSIKG